MSKAVSKFSQKAEALSGLGGAKWALHFAAKTKLAAGEDVITLSIGEPEIAPPSELAEATKQALDQGLVGYTNGAGTLALREVLAARYSRRSGRVIVPEQVLSVSGTQNALYLALQTLAGPGDEVLVTDPLYATYEGVVRASGATPVFVPLRPEHNFHLQADDLAEKISSKTKLLLLNSPHNPTGAVLSAHEIRAIGDLAKAHDFWIVSDEVYEELVFDGVPFASAFDQVDLADRIVAVASISKSHAAAGYRAGWLVGPQAFYQAALPITETEIFGTPPFIQASTTQLLAQGPSSVAPLMRANYARRAARVYERFEGQGGLRVMRPEAGTFVLLDARARGQSSMEFGTQLLEQAGVAVMPGSSFGEALEGFVRVSLTVEDEVLDRALDRILAIV